MLFADIYDNAALQCSKATSLINSTNEFFDCSMATSNGTVYSDDIHHCVINGAYLILFKAFECFLERSFICYLTGQAGINGNALIKYIAPQSEEHAYKILKGTGRFADFTNKETIVKLAENFFDGGGTYSCLYNITAAFEEMKKIRNAITHISNESESIFLNLVRNKLGSIPAGMNTATFLNTIVLDHNYTFFIHYRNIVVATIDQISTPQG